MQNRNIWLFRSCVGGYGIIMVCDKTCEQPHIIYLSLTNIYSLGLSRFLTSIGFLPLQERKTNIGNRRMEAMENSRVLYLILVHWITETWSMNYVPFIEMCLSLFCILLSWNTFKAEYFSQFRRPIDHLQFLEGTLAEHSEKARQAFPITDKITSLAKEAIPRKMKAIFLSPK